MSEEEIAYLTARAEAELALAQQATSPAVVQVHYELATAYLERIYEADESAGRTR